MNFLSKYIYWILIIGLVLGFALALFVDNVGIFRFTVWFLIAILIIDIIKVFRDIKMEFPKKNLRKVFLGSIIILIAFPILEILLDWMIDGSFSGWQDSMRVGVPLALSFLHFDLRQTLKSERKKNWN